MTPYSRFRLISNMATAALLAGTLCAAWPVGSALLVTALGTAGPVYQASVAGIAAALVLVSLMVSGWVFPALFSLGAVRKLVLGKHYVEGTWMMAERGPSGSERLTVLHVRPAGEGFGLSGYCLNQESEIESNRMIEYSKLDGPVLTYAYRSLMPDGAGNQSRGLSELMFEMRRGAPKAFSGHGEPVGGRRFPVEGVKLTKGSERRRLRKLEQRADVAEKYWGLFFGAAAEAVEDFPAVSRQDIRRPVIVTAARAEPAATPFVDRRSQDSAPADDGPVITRRRASDWRSEDTTPTADRIRARMMLNAEPETEEDLEDEDLLLETEVDEDDAAFDAEDEVMLEADAEEFGDEAEELDDEEEYEADAEDDEPFDEDDEELELEADADLEDEEEAEYEADADDAAEQEGAETAVTEDEPVRIRQRYARRR